MRKSPTSSVLLVCGVAAALAGAECARGAMLFTESAAFDAAMTRMHLEGFDALSAGGAPGSFHFDGAVTADLLSSGVAEHLIVVTADGHGAVYADGDRFWKLRGGTTTLTLSGLAVNAFGFFYSDLEQATLRISSIDGAFAPIELRDNNPGANRFFGLRADGPIGLITIDWMSSQGDGVGIDGFRLGYSAAVPTPGPLAMGFVGLAMMGVTRRRRVA